MTTERKAAGPISACRVCAHDVADGGQGCGTRADRHVWIQLLFALVASGAFLIPAAIAGAQDALPLQEVTWAHPTPGWVQGFVIFVSPVAGLEDATRQITVGKPAGRSMDNDGMWAFTAIVPAAYDEFLAVAAVGPDGTHSPLSSWSVVVPTAPGQPLLIQP